MIKKNVLHQVEISMSEKKTAFGAFQNLGWKRGSKDGAAPSRDADVRSALHFILYWRSDVTIQQSTVGSLQRSANMIKRDKKKKKKRSLTT